MRHISREAARQNANTECLLKIASKKIQRQLSKAIIVATMGNSMKGCSNSVIFKPLSLAAEIARLVRPFGLVIKNHYPDCQCTMFRKRPRYAHRRIPQCFMAPVYMHLASSHQSRRSNQENHKSTSHFRHPSLEPLPFRLLRGSQARP